MKDTTPKFFGSTTLGKKGQVVIPMETRNDMKWEDGEKLLVFGMDNGMVILTTLAHAQELTSALEKKANTMKNYIDKLK